MSRRRFWMLVHRVNGLLLAVFLSVVGLTGSVIAWNDALERVFAPELFVLPAHSSSQAMLDPFLLREIVAHAHPEAQVNGADLQRLSDAPGQFSLELPPATHGTEPQRLENDTVFVDPYSGRILGERMTGDIFQGRKNLIPFVYRLHEELALGEVGQLSLGIAALLWTIDCFIGMYLTFPARTKATGKALAARIQLWPMRWRPSWLIRWRQGPARRNYDVHRASGLWPWVMLLIFAWSGVAFNLPSVYGPVMHIFGASDERYAPSNSFCSVVPAPALDWQDAYRRAQGLMDKQAQRLQFRVRSERFISYDPQRCVFMYRVKSTRDIGILGNTQITFGRDAAEVLTVTVPTGETSANTFSTWIENLHEAQVFGLWFRVLVCITGLVIVMLSVTGFLIFIKKMRRPVIPRQASESRPGAPNPAVPHR